MDTNPRALIKAFLPKVPLIGKTAVFHTLGLSETSSEWDLKTELIVKLIRSFMAPSVPEPVSKSQHLSLKDPGIKGKMWISKVKLRRPEEDSVRNVLIEAIERLKEPGQAEGGYTVPDILPVEAEWTGYRAAADKGSPELNISEPDKYKEMMKEVTSNVTILYFHGGAHFLMDPASHRLVTSKLAKLTKGRCLSVRYRLSPQNPFPAALLDALVAYLHLLYPPEGSLHVGVPATNVVFSGDSAGANLCMGLLQAIIEFNRHNNTIVFNGNVCHIPVPAGIVCSSAWLDVTHSLPSCSKNTKYDYLPHLSAVPQYPPCPIWPASPPRHHFYAEDALLCHPLVSPLAAASWEGSCPMLLTTGEELLSDENNYVAGLAASQDVTVVYEQYAAMPHCFGFIFDGSPGSKKSYENWTKFIQSVVSEPNSVKTTAVSYAPKTMKETAVDLSSFRTSTRDQILTGMKGSLTDLLMKGEGNMAKL